MNKPMLPSIVSKYLERICREYFKAVKKHPKFARHWFPACNHKSSYKFWMEQIQSINNIDEAEDRQRVSKVFEEEDVEAFESIARGDERNARTELIQGIVVRLRALEKLDREGC